MAAVTALTIYLGTTLLSKYSQARRNTLFDLWGGGQHPLFRFNHPGRHIKTLTLRKTFRLNSNHLRAQWLKFRRLKQGNFKSTVQLPLLLRILECSVNYPTQYQTRQWHFWYGTYTLIFLTCWGDNMQYIHHVLHSILRCYRCIT